MTSNTKAKKAQVAQVPGPQKMRHMYTGEERAELVSKLTTRVPYQLRAHLKTVTAWPIFGFRTQTQMFSQCLVDFIRLRPWEAGLKWRQSYKASPEYPLYHMHLEPTEVTGKLVTGVELKDRAMEIADEEGVNQATFALTWLWWIALHHKRIDNDDIMAPLMAAKGAVV
ncbi:hypothetical protein ACG04R_16290 [Roseateles sp. BYS78W]|uniref:Uncharacterized protein n=1 Tax=Pelomonas candidula TaxID=3299025 RepID=A0ABW7HEJ8_9BURK